MPECASGPEVQTPDSQFAGQQVNRNGGRARGWGEWRAGVQGRTRSELNNTESSQKHSRGVVGGKTRGQESMPGMLI